jgi:hypothetical protein
VARKKKQDEPEQPQEEFAPDVDGKMVLQFHGCWTKYQPEDVAGFEPFLARQLLEMKMVDPRGHKRPLCSRYKKPVLERLGVTKGGARNPSEPIGGTDERKVVGPTSPELVGGPAQRRRGR